MNTHDWLCSIQPGYAQLGDAERSAVADFTMVWSVFEARALDCQASVTAICDFVDQHEQAFDDVAPIFECFKYFERRYYSEASFNHDFESLNFRERDRRELVEEVLSGSATAPTDVTKGLLIIVYRLRNNLFHGLKWVEKMQGQQCNFNHACQVLTFAFNRSSVH